LLTKALENLRQADDDKTAQQCTQDKNAVVF